MIKRRRFFYPTHLRKHSCGSYILVRTVGNRCITQVCLETYGWSVQLTYGRKDLGWFYIKHMHTTADRVTLLGAAVSHDIFYEIKHYASLPIPTKYNFGDVLNFI